MIWRSQKALDLLRDPRCAIHNAVSDRNGLEGEFKVYGRAFDITNPGERQKYVKALFEKIGFQPSDQEFHCFTIDIESVAANTLVGEEFQHQVCKSR